MRHLQVWASVRFRGFNGVLNVRNGRELDVVELPVLALHFPHIDVLHVKDPVKAAKSN